MGAALAALAAAGIYIAWPPAPVPCSALQHWGATESGGRCLINTSLRLDSYDTQSRDLRRLPARLTVKGNLVIYGTRIDALPDSLMVEGNLVLHKTSIGKLPADLVVNGDLDTYAGFGSPPLLCSEISPTVIIKGSRGCSN